MLVDSHAPLDDPAFDSDPPAVPDRALEAGVERIVTIEEVHEAPSRNARNLFCLA